MQEDTIAQFLQVWGPALGPAGAESSSAAPAASALSSIPDRNVFCTCNCLSQQGTAHGTRHTHACLGGPCVAPVAAWQGWSPKYPSLIDGDSPAPSHPRHAGKVSRRNSTEVFSLFWDRSQRFILAPHHAESSPSVPGIPAPCLCSLTPRPPAQQSRSAPPGSCYQRVCCCCGMSPPSPPLSGRWSQEWTRLSDAWSSARRRQGRVSAAGRGTGGADTCPTSPPIPLITSHSPHHTQPWSSPSPAVRMEEGEPGSEGTTAAMNREESP